MLVVYANSLPSINSVNISPTYPIYFDNLNCSFSINDNDSEDTISYKYVWYNGSNFFSSGVGTYSSSNNYVVLSHTNIRTGEYWTCQINATDNLFYTLPLNSSQKLIYQLPIITLWNEPDGTDVTSRTPGDWTWINLSANWTLLQPDNWSVYINNREIYTQTTNVNLSFNWTYIIGYYNYKWDVRWCYKGLCFWSDNGNWSFKKVGGEGACSCGSGGGLEQIIFLQENMKTCLHLYSCIYKKF